MSIAVALASNDKSIAPLRNKVDELSRFIEASGAVALYTPQGTAPPLRIGEHVQRNSGDTDQIESADASGQQKVRDKVWSDSLTKGSRKFVKLFSGVGQSSGGLGSTTVALDGHF